LANVQALTSARSDDSQQPVVELLN
jgi:hypothetical protein